MFEDRSKSKYDFKKMDAEARIKTQVIVDDKSDAHKKLFGEIKKTSIQTVKADIKNEIIKHTSTTSSLESLPSSAYLKQFENEVVEDQKESVVEEEQITKAPTTDIDFVSLIEDSKNVEVDTKAISNELEKVLPKQKKNYSFRIKLVTGVYCILVALFGGWVIGNAIDISQTNSYLYETTAKTAQVNSNIADIIGDLTKLDSVSSDPEDDTIVVKIITQEIDIKPEPITKPNEYKKSSNWFDVICNWIARLFGGK